MCDFTISKHLARSPWKTEARALFSRLLPTSSSRTLRLFYFAPAPVRFVEMIGSNLDQALQSLEQRVKNRFVALSDEDWNSFACVNGLGWFVRWHLPVEHDRARHSEQVSTGGRIPMGPTIFRRVPTVACEVLNPLMSSLLEKGFDIEWYIIVVGKRELSDSNQKLYERLCRATRGQFLSIGTGGWNENKDETARFLEAVEDSGYDISERDRRHRQQQYQR